MAFLEIDRVHIARQLMAIRSSYTNLNFINFLLETKLNHFRAEAKSLIPGIDRSMVQNITFSLPPTEEQKAIVEKVETLMAQCQVLEEEIMQSEEHANMLMQAVLKEAFEGGPAATNG